jgi:hypothetical protein
MQRGVPARRVARAEAVDPQIVSRRVLRRREKPYRAGRDRAERAEDDEPTPAARRQACERSRSEEERHGRVRSDEGKGNGHTADARCTGEKAEGRPRNEEHDGGDRSPDYT